ncbi:MAG: NAD(P)-dependent oxidoreductase [Treponema sp.]|nr:NAD(P)-dependent oxidoreductase [Treponema sp.]
MTTALITGANGFIGRNLITRLLKEGIRIYAVVLPEESVSDCLLSENVTIVRENLENSQLDVSLFPEKIDVLYHFAWIGVNPESRKSFEVQKRNISLLLNTLNLAKNLKVAKFILPGSTNEYLYSGGLINSKSIPTPRDDYGSMKVATRYIAKQFCADNEIDFVYAVISGIYSEQRKDSNVITYTIEKLLKGEKPSLSKLEQKWDYVHIDDAVEALYLIGEKGKNGAFYAIGHGDNIPLSSYIRIIHKKINTAIPLGIGEVPYFYAELPSSCIDLTALQRDTGFIPKISFEEGISRVIENMRH